MTGCGPAMVLPPIILSGWAILRGTKLVTQIHTLTAAPNATVQIWTMDSHRLVSIATGRAERAFRQTIRF